MSSSFVTWFLHLHHINRCDVPILDLGLDLVLELWIKLLLSLDSDCCPWIRTTLRALFISMLKSFLQHILLILHISTLE
jgi:hypothetical protein